MRQWLHDNIYLTNQFPFNKTFELIDKVLEDFVKLLGASSKTDVTKENVRVHIMTLREY